MNSGKTTTAQQLVHALARGGYRVGATKVTGTGSGGDYWMMMDAGAYRTLDFTDVGFASTYQVDMAAVECKSAELIDHLAASGCEAIVVEVADGLFQRETAQLLQSEVFRSRIDGVLFTARDAIGAMGGYQRLCLLDLNVIGISGRLTCSPLATREAASACSAPILTLEQLDDPATALALFGLELPSGLAHPSREVVSALSPDAKPGPAGVVEPAADVGPSGRQLRPVG